MELQPVTDHSERALGRTAVDLRGTEFENLVRVMLVGNAAHGAQRIEDALQAAFKVIRNPALAQTWVLDRIGELVGAEGRGTLNDAQYRTRIDAAIVRSKAWGRPEDQLNGLVAFFPQWLVSNGGPGVRLDDANSSRAGIGCAVLRPASYEAADGYTAITALEAEEFMRYLSRVGGTRVIFEYAATARAGAGTLGRFDDATNGFDVSRFSGAVDQKTRNPF